MSFSLFKKKGEKGEGTPRKTVITLGAKKSKENPYLNTARAWNGYHQEILAAKRIWQFLAIIGLMIAFSSVAGIVYIGLQSKFVPYIVAVDKLGEAVAVSPAERTQAIDQRIIHAQIASFVHDMRIVTPDVILQKRAIYNVYSMLNPKDPATVKLNEWFNGDSDSSPFKRAEKFTVSVAISSVIPQSPDTWQVDWVESVRERNGKLIENIRQRALVTVYTVETTRDTTIDQLRRNPSGLYVRDISWSRQVN